MSQPRKKRALKALNPDIVDLTEEDIFKTFSPNLFGPGLEGKMERAKLVKASDRIKSHAFESKVFSRKPPPALPLKGGSQPRRGGRQ